jgi:polyhydroxyalkanoate synthesis regulator protein
MFAPFSKTRTEEENNAQEKSEPANPATSKEIAELKAQLSAMQDQLDRLSKSTSTGE